MMGLRISLSPCPNILENPEPPFVTNTTDKFADLLLKARSSGVQIAAKDLADEPQSLSDAYAVHKAVAQAIGPIGGFKTGPLPDGPHIIAPIFTQNIHATPHTLDAPMGGGQTGVELEVGFRVIATPPPASAPDFEKLLRACVEPLCAMEIIGSRLVDSDGAAPMTKLADNQVNNTLITSKSVSDWQDLDLTNVTASFHLGEKTAFEGSAAVPGGNAFETLCTAARLIEQHWGGLKEGQFVITGALNGLFLADAGIKVSGKIKGLGAVEATTA